MHMQNELKTAACMSSEEAASGMCVTPSNTTHRSGDHSGSLLHHICGFHIGFRPIFSSESPCILPFPALAKWQDATLMCLNPSEDRSGYHQHAGSYNCPGDFFSSFNDRWASYAADVSQYRMFRLEALSFVPSTNLTACRSSAAALPGLPFAHFDVALTVSVSLHASAGRASLRCNGA